MKHNVKMMGQYFYGQKISDYGLEHNRVDYGTLARAFDCVLNNEIMPKTWGTVTEWDQLSGYINNESEISDLEEELESLRNSQENPGAAWPGDREQVIANNERLQEQIETLEERIEELEEEQERQPEVYQWYIISDPFAELLQEINEIVYYSEDLDMYLWGVTHYGTSWDYVLTDIPCCCGYGNDNPESEKDILPF